MNSLVHYPILCTCTLWACSVSIAHPSGVAHTVWLPNVEGTKDEVKRTKVPPTRDFDKIFPDTRYWKYFLGETPDIMIVGHTWQPPLQPDLRRLIVKEFPTRMHFTWDCEYCEQTFLKRFFKEFSQLRYQIFCYQPCNLIYKDKNPKEFEIFMIVRERER